MFCFAGHDEFSEESVQQTDFEREVHYFISDLVCIECDLKECTFKSTAHFIIDIMAKMFLIQCQRKEPRNRFLITIVAGLTLSSATRSS